MKIEKGHMTPPHPHDAVLARRETPTSGPVVPADASNADHRRSDRVELSSDARALAEQTPLDPGRLGEIRERIRSGLYNSPEVADAVARKLVGRLGE